MIVALTDLAKEQIHSIYDYIASHSKKNADLVLMRIFGILELLTTSPSIGQALPNGTRSFAVPKTPYKLVYRVRGEEVQVLAVLHGAQSTSKHFFVQ